MKIKHKLLLGLLSFALLIWVVGFYAVSVGQRALRQSIESSTAALAANMIDEIDRAIEKRIDLLGEYVTSPTIQDALEEANLEFEKLPNVRTVIDERDKAWRAAGGPEVTPFMKQLIEHPLSAELRRKCRFYEQNEHHSVFAEVFLTNRFGANIAQTGKTSDYRQDDEEWWQLARSEGTHVTDIAYDESSSVYSINICLRVDDSRGHFAGVMKAVLNIQGKLSFLKEAALGGMAAEGGPTACRLLTADGRMIYATGRFKQLEDASDIFPGKVVPAGHRTGTFTREGESGEILAVYARSKGSDCYRGHGWIIVVEYRTREVFASVMALRRSILLIALGVTVIAVLMGLIIPMSISRRVTSLRDATVGLGSGDLDIRVDEGSSDEIGDLARSLNVMTANLRTITASRDALNREVTQRKRVEAEVRRLATIVEQAAEGVAVADLDGHLTFVNAAWARMHGYTVDELFGRHLSISHTEEQLHRDVIPDIEQTKAEGHHSGEVGHVRRDGTTFPTYMTTTVLRDDAGEPTGLIGFATDITERKRVEAEVRRLAAIAEQVAEGIAVADPDGNLTFVNAAWARMHGYTVDELLGRHLSIFHTEEQLHRDVIPFNERAKAEGHDSAEVGHMRRDGTTFPTYMTTTVLRDDAGEPTGLIGFATDITERKRAEEALVEARETAERATRELADSNLQLKQAIMRANELARQAEVATRAKSEFLANMSHEIRTPMNGIIGMTDLLMDTELNAEQREYLEMVRDSAQGLLTLLNDILDFSKIEAGKLEMESTDFPLRDSIGDAVRALALSAHQKGLELAYHVHPDVPDALVGDPGRLRQIVTNLVGNAVKFTQEGEVVLHVQGDSETPDEVRLHFSVSDTGIGIPGEKRRAVFEAFSQVDGSTTRKFGGTGLGLAISSQLVGMMGGRIWVESPSRSNASGRGGPGSTFHFTACFGRGRPQEPPLTADLEELEGLRVLIIDDNATNRRIFEEMLKGWRMNPTAAGDAADGLASLKQAGDSGTPFRLVLLDLHMPDTDGFAFAENIRRRPEFDDIVIIMLTSATQRSDSERCRELRIAAHRTKPIKESDLLDTILTAFGKHPARHETEEVASPPMTPQDRPRLRVLLAEDNPVNQKLVVTLLGREGHSVEAVGNGEEAVEAVKRERFDVVLMDVQMPVLDGLKAAGMIREHESEVGGHVPIIAMTAHSMKGDRERCMAAGMDGYVPKPVRKDALFEEMARLLPDVRARGTETPVRLSGDGPIDGEALLEHVGGDRKLLEEMVELFRSDTPRLLAEIREAIARGDGEALARVAHTLKGSVGNFSAATAVAAARELENIGRRAELGGAAQAAQRLEEEIRQLESVLVAFVGRGAPTGAPEN